MPLAPPPLAPTVLVAGRRPALAPLADGVTVVMPAYNAADYVGQAIESVQRQTDRDLELVVVDDGSTDETRAVAEGYAVHDPRIRVLSGPNEGISAATNRGIFAAGRAWVAVLHADDVALPHRIERQRAAAAAHPEVVLWASYAFHIGPDGQRLSLSASGPTSRDEYEVRMRTGQLVGNVIASSALFRRRDALAVGGFDPQFQTAEDLEFFERLGDLGPVVALPEPLVERRVHASTNTVRTFLEMQRVTRWLRARRAAGHAGGPAPTYDAFREGEVRRPALARLADARADLGRFLYHAAGVEYGSRRAHRAALRFAQAALCAPEYALPRAWRQWAGLRDAERAAGAPVTGAAVTGAPVAEPAEVGGP